MLEAVVCVLPLICARGEAGIEIAPAAELRLDTEAGKAYLLQKSIDLEAWSTEEELAGSATAVYRLRSMRQSEDGFFRLIEKPPSEFLGLSESFEGGLNQWVTSGSDWGLDDSAARTGGNSLSDSPGGNYSANANAVATLASPIDLNEAVQPVLSFWHQHQLESTRDFARLQISADTGISWTTVSEWTGIISNWTLEQIDLSAYIDTGLTMRFCLLSNNISSELDGWHIDDVNVREL